MEWEGWNEEGWSIEGWSGEGCSTGASLWAPSPLPHPLRLHPCGFIPAVPKRASSCVFFSPALQLIGVRILPRCCHTLG